MNLDQIQGNLKEFEGQMRKKFAGLTNEEIEGAKGDRQKLEGLLQQKYGIAKEEAKEKIDGIIKQIR